MTKIATIQEALDLLFDYAKEEHNRELKKIYRESINRAIYTVKQWGFSS